MCKVLCHLFAWLLIEKKTFFLTIGFAVSAPLLRPGMWKRKLEAVEAVLFLWKRKQKRENSTATAST